MTCPACFPMLGPKTPTREGLKEKLDRLLAALTEANVDATKIWFDARKDTKHLVHEVFAWRDELHTPDRSLTVSYTHLTLPTKRIV